MPLAREWDSAGPPALWTIDVGEGYAGPAILNGRVYLLDYDREAQADALRCLSLEDGREIWRYAYPVKIKRNHGMSRTVPAVTDRFVVALGPYCHVTCLDSQTGSLKWGLDLVRDFGVEVPAWYAGQCPIIDEGKAILAPGGSSALMMAVDCETGNILWKTPNPRRWKMTHSSIVPMNLLGKPTYVYCGSGGVAGISPSDGSILWETDLWKISIATIPCPVRIGSDRIFVSGGYNSGSMMLRIEERDGHLAAKSVFRLKPEDFGATQQTPILYQDHIYGVRPNGEFACLDLEGRIKWTSGNQHRYGLGPFLIADGLVFVMNDEGLLSLLEANPDEFRLLAQAKVLQGHDSWGPMALVAGRLIARDFTRMVCLDVKRQ